MSRTLGKLVGQGRIWSARVFCLALLLVKNLDSFTDLKLKRAQDLRLFLKKKNKIKYYTLWQFYTTYFPSLPQLPYEPLGPFAYLASIGTGMETLQWQNTH